MIRNSGRRILTISEKLIFNRCHRDGSILNHFKRCFSEKQDTELIASNPTFETSEVIKDISFSPPMPFEEIPITAELPEKDLHPAEFINSLGPPLPISFNLAAYVNNSETLTKLVQLGVDLSAIERTPEKAKYILKLDFEKDIKLHIQFLHDHGVESDALGLFITKNPFIFKETIENLEIRINYLKSKKFSDSSISRIITKDPLFLSMTTKKVDSRLGFFQKQFFLSGDEVRYLITKTPKLVSYNFQKILEKLFIHKEVLGFSSGEMKKLLLAKPKIWMLGPKALKERFDIVHNYMGISHEQILKFPEVFLKRGFILKQRHQYLVYLGLAQYDSTKPMYVSLHEIATTSDNDFCRTCAKTSVEKYNEFLKTI